MEQTIVVVPQAVELRPLARGLQELGHEVRRAAVGKHFRPASEIMGARRVMKGDWR